MTPEEIEQAVEKAVTKVLTEYSISAKDHYDQHQFLKRLMDYSDSVNNWVLKSIVVAVTTAVIGMFVLGFVFWGKKNF